jgi:hypothetical protein
MKRAPRHIREFAQAKNRATHGATLHIMGRPGPCDAKCQRCDDCGVIPIGPSQWQACTCAAGGRVLEQLGDREAKCHAR